MKVVWKEEIFRILTFKIILEDSDLISFTDA